LEVAYHTFYKDIAPVGDMFEAALSRNDLNGAKAANAIEQVAAQRFIDRLDAIDWPVQFESRPTFRYGYVNVLRDKLREVIEVRPSSCRCGRSGANRASGRGAGYQARDDAKDSLQNGLLKLRAESNPELQC
jgi:hypothetical protein